MTAREFAKLINVSPSTVSMVINNRPGISEERRKQVLALLKEHGCEHLLKATGGKNIGFVVYKNSGDILGEAPFFQLLMESVSMAVQDRGYNLLFMQVVKDASIDEQVRVVQGNNCAGLIIFATEAEENDMAFFRSLGTPFVILDNDFSDEGASSVCINNRQGILLAMRHLHRIGHRNIGYIHSRAEIHSFRSRFAVYREQMERWGYAVTNDCVAGVSYSEIGSRRDMLEWLKAHPGGDAIPTAFVADNDLLAYGVVGALKEFGLRVPEDVSVIGFDDRPVCMLCEPTLSTIAVPRDAFGSAAVELLGWQLEGKSELSYKIEVGVKLENRESVAPPDRRNKL